MANKYITTPIYYVNDIPHIGHAYTTIAADVLNRYYKQRGDESYFLTGTDEHGAKIAEAAKNSGQNPKDFVDGLVPHFKSAWKLLNVGYDGFIRTTDKGHEKVVLEFIEKLKENGFIEKRKYEGNYCVGCEKFVTDDDLKDGKCPDHGKEPIKHSEENYFFLLSKLEKKLLEIIESDKYEIRPESRKKEIVGKIKQGLDDVSISRQAVDWGIKFPGDDTQTVYVWVDALINYYSATTYMKDAPSWPASLHIIGKDILWFHAVIWPAMLLAIKKDLPKKLFAHGFFTIGGKKMSKTLGNAIDPSILVKKFGADAIRYAILKEFPFGEDGDISEEKIKERYRNDLGNEVGNLVQRTLSMIVKYGVKIEKIETLKCDSNNCIDKNIESLEFDRALEKLWSCARKQNKFIDDKKPWELAKAGDVEKLKSVLQSVYGFLVIFSDQVAPFMPTTSSTIKKQLKELKPEPLFPRLED